MSTNTATKEASCNMKMLKKNTISDKKAEIHSISEKTKKSNSQGAELLKKMTKEGIIGTRILAHNGIVAIIFGMTALLLGIIALEAAYMFVAFAIGQAGAYGLQTVADMVTMYTSIIMVSGICLFIYVKICNALFRAMSRRFWKKDYVTGDIDKGEIWHLKHPES